jgi:hypothetical protein
MSGNELTGDGRSRGSMPAIQRFGLAFWPVLIILQTGLIKILLDKSMLQMVHIVRFLKAPLNRR